MHPCRGTEAVQAVRPVGGSRGIVLLFLDHGTRRGAWLASHPDRFLPREDPVLIVQEAGWALGPVWTDAENLASTGIRSPDRPARSQSLYRLLYPAHVGSKQTDFIGPLVGRQHARRIGFSVATTTNNKVVYFYFLVWSVSSLSCCLSPGCSVALP